MLYGDANSVATANGAAREDKCKFGATSRRRRLLSAPEGAINILLEYLDIRFDSIISDPQLRKIKLLPDIKGNSKRILSVVKNFDICRS